MVAGQGSGNAEVRAELLRMAGILRGDDADFLQHAHGAEGDVFQIPDRGADNVQSAGFGIVHGAHPS
jgi:hypothetical protein